MNAKPGVLAVLDAELEELAFHPADTERFKAMQEARATIERMAGTLAFIEINASAGELSAEGCAIQARAALAAFRGES